MSNESLKVFYVIGPDYGVEEYANSVSPGAVVVRPSRVRSGTPNGPLIPLEQILATEFNQTLRFGNPVCVHINHIRDKQLSTAFLDYSVDPPAIAQELREAVTKISHHFGVTCEIPTFYYDPKIEFDLTKILGEAKSE